MSRVTHKITLDIHKRGTQVFVSAFRGDTLRTIIASLTERGKPYIIPEGCTVVFTAVKPDGNFLYNDCTVDTVTNSIIYDLTLQTTAAVGEVKSQFKIIGADGGVLAAPIFSILVGDTLYNEELIVDSSEEFTALTEFLASLSDQFVNNEAKVVALSAPNANTTGGVGYGTCIVMHDKHTCLVFDLGNDEGATLYSYLDSEGIKTIDAIFISHFHSDHYQESTLQKLFTEYNVKNIILPHAAIDWDQTIGSIDAYHILYNNAKSNAMNAKATCHEPTDEGVKLTYGEFTITCHNVSSAYMQKHYGWNYNEVYDDKGCANYNNFSMVNVVTFAGKKIVVTGDIMETAVDATVDVLSLADLIFVPHHGLDMMTGHSAFNRLISQHAVINTAYDTDNHLLKVSRAFAGQLLKKGCRVTTTHNGERVVYIVTEGGVIPIENGTFAGNEIYPCILEPSTDLDTLPDGEYITFNEVQAKTMIHGPTFATPYKKFKLIVEPAYYYGSVRTQTAYNVHTTHNPEIARRSYGDSAWGAWGVFFPYDKFHAQVEASSDDEVDATLISQIAEMKDKSHRRIVISLTEVLLSIGTGGHWDVVIFKQSTNYATITAKSPLHYGTTLQRVWFEGVLYDWEWENPRLVEGVEYRTTERYKDKAVYKKVGSDGNIMCRLDGSTEWKSYASLLGASGATADTTEIVNSVLAALPTWTGGSY